MESSAEKIHKPKNWLAGKTKVGGIRVRIEWRIQEAVPACSGERQPKTYVSLKGSRGRRTGVARSLNPYCGKFPPTAIPRKVVGQAFLDPNGDFVISKVPEREHPTNWHLYMNSPMFAWEGEEIPDIIKKL